MAVNQREKRYRIFILGAGFSHAAGIPLAVELWHEVKRRARGLSGRAEKFRDDLKTFIQYKKDCDGITLTPDQVNFEEFLAFLDIEHFLGLRGSDTWSVDGNETQVVIKTLIAEILAERMPSVENIPPLYKRFAENLRPSDYVLTFNYDVLLERALESVGKPYRLFPTRYKSIGKSTGEVDSSHEEVVILKLHGSIDWFNRAQHSELEEQLKAQGLQPSLPHPVFENMGLLNVVPLVDGPRFPNDPLRHMYRVRELEALYSRQILFHCTPWLLNPSSMKILYATTLQDFWDGLGNSGAFNFGLAVIGFSLPQHDDYTRQALYRLIKNYQTIHWDEDLYGLKKRPLTLIDYRQSEEEINEYKRRFSFVDWEKAQTYFDGFNENAMNLLFDN